MKHTTHYALYQCRARIYSERADSCGWFLRTTLRYGTKRGTIEQHSHYVSSIIQKRGGKLNLQMKRFIRERAKKKLKASRILNAKIDARLFDRKPEAAEFLRPVQCYAHQFRTRGLGDNGDVGEMKQLLENRPYHPDLPDTTAFGFSCPTNDVDRPTFSRGLARWPIFIGFAPKATICNLVFAKDLILHVDATFKLDTAGFPSYRRRF